MSEVKWVAIMQILNWQTQGNKAEPLAFIIHQHNWRVKTVRQFKLLPHGISRIRTVNILPLPPANTWGIKLIITFTRTIGWYFLAFTPRHRSQSIFVLVRITKNFFCILHRKLRGKLNLTYMSKHNIRLS